MALTFRTAVLQDLPTILRLNHEGDWRGEAAPPFDPDSASDPRYRAAFEEIARDPNHQLFVAEEGGEIVGTIQISVIPGLSRFGMKRGLLEGVHVRKDRRGTGLGTQMVQWATEECRKAGCGMVQLTSNKARQDAHRFYRKLGFEQSHEGFKKFL
jgi:GNAT superfamily N-acetyltransferase